MSFEPEKITKEHVLEAIRLIKLEAKTLIPSTGYDVIIDSIPYPPKEVMRYSHKVMNGETIWNYPGGEPTNSFLSKMGFKIINKFQREHGYPTKLIIKYKKLLNERQFEGETYKWEFTKRYNHRPDVQALDFNKEIQEINFSNLIYYTGIQVCHHIAKERPEEYRNAFKSLFDESVDLTTRVNRFDEEVMGIYREIDPINKFSHHHDERTISTFLAFYDSNKYPFFKDSFYQKYCKLIGVKPGDKGKKYSHYLNLLDEFIENFVLPDSELLTLKEKYLPNDSYLDKNQYILAQDILYRTLDDSENDEIKYWRIGTTDGTKSLWSIMMQNNYVSIGWSELGNLSEQKIENRADVSELLLGAGYYEAQNAVRSRKAGEILNFYKEIKIGDIIIAQDGSKVLGIGSVTDGYGFDEEAYFPHFRPIVWKVVDPPDFYSELGKLTTVFPLTDPELIAKINYFLEQKTEIPQKNNMAKNIILYGPPGTGKTYNSIDKAVEIAADQRFVPDSHSTNKKVFDELRKTGQIEFITFHQNYSYEDFVVGLRPDVENEQLRFRTHRGIFYELARRARENYMASKEKTALAKTFEEAFNEIIKPFILDGQELSIEMASGISFIITDITDYAVHFKKPRGDSHHSLSIQTLQDIVEGRREMVSGLAAYYNPLVNEIKALMKPVAGAKSETLKSFVLIIDEINRANISKVFGELITLLEDDKRLGEENELKVTLPNGEKDFGIPPNLYIIGTMNTADKSIALIDIALRRRFEFIGYYPKYEKFDPNAIKLLQKINSNIYDKKKSADYLIGHAYFMKKQPIESVLNNKVIPLLMEYFSCKTDLVKDIFEGSDWTVSYDSNSYSWIINKN